MAQREAAVDKRLMSARQRRELGRSTPWASADQRVSSWMTHPVTSPPLNYTPMGWKEDADSNSSWTQSSAEDWSLLSERDWCEVDFANPEGAVSTAAPVTESSNHPPCARMCYRVATPVEGPPQPEGAPPPSSWSSGGEPPLPEWPSEFRTDSPRTSSPKLQSSPLTCSLPVPPCCSLETPVPPPLAFADVPVGVESPPVAAAAESRAVSPLDDVEGMFDPAAEAQQRLSVMRAFPLESPSSVTNRLIRTSARVSERKSAPNGACSSGHGERVSGQDPLQHSGRLPIWQPGSDPYHRAVARPWNIDGQAVIKSSIVGV